MLITDILNISEFDENDLIVEVEIYNHGNGNTTGIPMTYRIANETSGMALLDSLRINLNLVPTSNKVSRDLLVKADELLQLLKQRSNKIRHPTNISVNGSERLQDSIFREPTPEEINRAIELIRNMS